MDVLKPVRVVLDLEHTDGTISGEISGAGIPACGFHGWLELIDRLERAVSADGLPSGEGRRGGPQRRSERSDPRNEG